MITEDYQKTNFTWQIKQFQQRLGEWWEVQLRNFNLDWLNQPYHKTDPNSSLLEEIFKISLLLILISLLTLVILRIAQRLPYYKKVKKQVTRPLKIRKNKSMLAGEWFKKSQLFHQEGDYYQACRCLYMAMIQQLDEKGLISQLDSRTDEEYRYLTLQLSNPYPYHTLLQIHQELCFGSREVSPALWQECQQAYQEIEKQI